MTEEYLWNGVRMQNPEDIFRLSADSVVLADFAAPERGGSVCDLGCGAGALMLMLLANDPTLRAVGVELQPRAA
ncbi:MAG: methyltransferase [Oscillospiraceae bacterium]|nr:methyltransferase [Oscillospiraceae bacterium]